MKFIKLLFLLDIVFIANVMAVPLKAKINYNKPVLDTIVQLDSIKNKNLYNLGQPKPKKGAQKAGAGKGKADTARKMGSGLDDKLTTTDEDSTYFDNTHKILYLYGSAHVKYQDVVMDADYIRVDQKNHLIFAKGGYDPVTHKYDVNRPLLKQGNDKPIECDSLLFNYTTKKGKLFNPASQQEQNYISGGEARKLNETEVAYRNVLFSTCDKPFPETDFGIVITKGIGEKNRIISGPAYLEVEGVPLPLAIPFGFFPKPDHRTSGVILPTFGEDAKLGFYIRNLGYYIALNDYIDLTTEGTLYSKGSYDVNVSSRYLSRYLYSGNFSLSYGSHNYGLEGDPSAKDFNITWAHTKNPNASPGSTFSASVNAGTSSFYQNNPASTNYNLEALTQNNLSSSISYSKQWLGTPFNLSVSLAHSQNLTAKTVTLNLPTIAFNMSTLSPFDSKDRVGEQKWYQKITVGYSLQATNLVNAVPEDELFKGNTLFKRMQNGIQHQIPVGFNQTLLKYFQFTASANYTEYWYLQTIKESYDRNNLIDPDAPVIDTVGGFKRAGAYNLSAGFSTKVYGTLNFKKGHLQAIRQVITPSIAFQYRPDFSDPSFGYYKTITSNAVIPYPATYNTYSIFQNGVYQGPAAGRSAGLNFSVDNTIEAKVRPKSTDTSNTPRHVKILDGLTFSTFYNFAADSFKLSPVTFSGHTAVFNQKLNITFNGTLNPYVTDIYDSVATGTVRKYYRMFDRYSWQDGKFPTLTNLSISMSGSLNQATFNPTKAPVTPNTLQNINPQQQQKLAMINSDPGAYVDFNIPWNISFNYSFSYQNTYTSSNTTNTIMLSGMLRLTQKWMIQYSTNYDLKARQLGSATSFSIYRDLHCWSLSMQWLPFGYYKSYNVTLRVNATILQDLKLSKKSDYTSNSYFNEQ